MALSAAVELRKRSDVTQSFIITNTAVVYVGGFCSIDSVGCVARAADTSSFVPVGFCIGFEDATAEGSKTGDTSASIPPEAIIDIGGGIVSGLAVTGASAQTDVRDLVYATSDNVFTTSATSNVPAVGMIVRFNTATSFDVLFFSAGAMALA
jgi:hypothetical protein